jgi:hypothetical protein
MIRKPLALCLGAMVGIACLFAAQPAQAWWAYGGPRIGLYLPPVVIGPPVVYAPPPVVYAPPPVAYAPPPRVWVPGVWVPGAWVHGAWVHGAWVPAHGS